MNVDHVLAQHGFEKLGHVSRLELGIWWQAQGKIEIHVIDLGFTVLLRGMKSYYLKALSEEGELYARDLDLFLDWLGGHFPEAHVSCASYRDIGYSLALSRTKEKRFRATGDEPDPELARARLSDIRREIEQRKTEVDGRQATKRLDALSSLKIPTQAPFLRAGEEEAKREVTRLSGEAKKTAEEIRVTEALLAAYQEDAEAVSLSFSIATEATWVRDEQELHVAVPATVEKLRNIHNHHIRQKLCHGALNIPVEESDDPLLDWLALWSGGFPSPKQLERWGHSLDEFRERLRPRMMVTPVRDIVVGGSVKDQKKLVAPRVLRSFLEKLPRVRKKATVSPDILTEGEWVGFVMEGNVVTDTVFRHPVNLQNGYVSGTTRAGKSYTARVLVENAIINGAVVIILDPTRQWLGLTRPTSDEASLERLDELGLGRDRATGFNVRTFQPDRGEKIPDDPEELLATSAVISLDYQYDDEAQNDEARCCLARDVLDRVLPYPEEEGDDLACMFVSDETHMLLPGNVDRKVEKIAKEVSSRINRFARTQVKYRRSILLVTQSLADFRGAGTRVVREMVNSRFFTRAHDQAELKFVEHYVSREAVEIVKNLRRGESLVHGALTPTAKVLIRPPLSDVRKPKEEPLHGEATQDRRGSAAAPSLGDQERAALDLVEKHYRASGGPIPASEFGKKLNARGGSRQRLIDGLKAKGLIRTVTVEGSGRGRPAQGIVPVSDFLPEGGTKW